MTLHETLEYFSPAIGGFILALTLGLSLGAVLTFFSLRKGIIVK